MTPFASPQIVLPITQSTTLSELLQLLKKCPKNAEVFLNVEKQWKFLHTIGAVKQIKEAAAHIQLCIFTQDLIAQKNITLVDIPQCSNIPSDARNYFDELYPSQKFYSNKVGEAFDAQKYEIIKIIQESGEEQLENIQTLKHQIEELPFMKKIVLGFLSLVSAGLIFFLIALLLPSAEITIYTEKKPIETIVNMNFIKTDASYLSPLKDSGNNFHLYPIELRFEHTMNYPVLSKIFEGQNAEGQIYLMNSFSEDITLRKGTRLENDQGLIFFTKHYVRIPAAKKEKNEKGEEVFVNGKAAVDIIASELDLYQEVIGERGNLQAGIIKIPGLTRYMQKFLWGEITNPLQGGTTRWRKEIQEADIIAATDKMNNILYSTAKEEIAKFIEKENTHLDYNLKLFPIEKFIRTEISKTTFQQASDLETKDSEGNIIKEAKVTTKDDLLGQKLSDFDIQGEMLVSGLVFYADAFDDLLYKKIELKKDPRMKVEVLDFKTMIFRPFQETPAEIRVATSIQGRQSFDLKNNKYSEISLEDKIKDYVKGRNYDDALNFIQNLTEVQNAEIKIWPPIKKQMPFVKDNIQIIEK